MNFSLLSFVACCCRCLCDTSYTRDGDECKPVVPCVPLSAPTTDEATTGGYDLSGCLNLESNGLSCEVKCKQGFTGSSTQWTCPATNWRSQTEASGPEPQCTPCAAGRYKADSVCCTLHPAFRRLSNNRAVLKGEAACSSCPAHATTNQDEAADISACLCEPGYEGTLVDDTVRQTSGPCACSLNLSTCCCAERMFRLQPRFRQTCRLDLVRRVFAGPVLRAEFAKLYRVPSGTSRHRF